MIVAAAHLAQCGSLLTDDLQDGQQFDGVAVVNPFTHASVAAAPAPPPAPP